MMKNNFNLFNSITNLKNRELRVENNVKIETTVIKVNSNFHLVKGLLFSLGLSTLMVGCQRNIAMDMPQTLSSPVSYNSSRSSVQSMSLGIGLNGIADWSTEHPFINHFKTARAWITQCIKSDPDCDGKWSTEENNLLDLDENGWVKSLPKPKDKPKFTRVSTLLFREIPNQFPGGKYVVLYDGEGTIEFGLAAKKIESESKMGRDVLEVDSSNGGGILLTITATDPRRNGNYIRNIRVVKAEQEELLNRGEIFNPLFLEKVKPFSTFRFMDWMKTNNSPQKEWRDRPTPQIASYALKGVSVETMVALGNKLKKDLWFNMPHQASDDYMRNFARLVKGKLDPNLKVYVEFSNEVWNWQFSQAHYALAEGKKRWNKEGDVYMQWYGMRTAQMCDIWKEVFGKEGDRIQCVMATQTGWQGLEKAALDCPEWQKEGNKPCYQHGISAYAITGYFGGVLGSPDNESTVVSWLNELDGGFSKAFEQLTKGGLLPSKRQDNLTQNFDEFIYHHKVAQERGLQLVAYEGGQHIVGINQVKNNQKLNNFFMEINRHPEMYNVYTQLLSDWQKAGGGLFMHFVDIGKPSQQGSWGALEYLEQSGSPKYNALIDFIQNKNLNNSNKTR